MAQKILKELKLGGMSALYGRWSENEVQQLEENMRNYIAENPSIDIVHLLYGSNGKETKILLKSTAFWNRVAFKIQRTLHNIMVKVTYHFKTWFGFKTGPFSKTELKQLGELAVKYDKNWFIVSKIMNRYWMDIATKYNKYCRNNLKQGLWSKNELLKYSRITAAILRANKKQNIDNNKINWRMVSDFLKTRCISSCSEKWRHDPLLRERIYNLSNSDLNHKFGKKHKRALIIYLYYADTDSFDWDEIVNLFCFHYSKQYIKSRWVKLKAIVPKTYCKSARTIVDYLYDMYCMDEERNGRNICYENVVKFMCFPKSPQWLRAKFYLLKQDLPNHKNMSAEDIITGLHNKYKHIPIIEDHVPAGALPLYEGDKISKFNANKFQIPFAGMYIINQECDADAFKCI